MESVIEKAKEIIIDGNGYPSTTVDILFDAGHVEPNPGEDAESLASRAIDFLDSLSDEELEELDLY